MTICYQEYCNVGCNKNVPLLHQLIVCDVFELGCPKQHACIMSNTLAAKAEHIRLLDIKISIKLRGGALWLRQQRLMDMKCTVHGLEVMDLNPRWVELGVHST